MHIDPISPMPAVIDVPGPSASSTALPQPAVSVPQAKENGSVVAEFAGSTVVYQMLNAKGDVIEQLPSQQVLDMRRDIETMLEEARAKNPRAF
jgi:hypothetical protein